MAERSRPSVTKAWTTARVTRVLEHVTVATGHGAYAGYTLTSVAFTTTHTGSPRSRLNSRTAAGVTSATIAGVPSRRTRTRSPWKSRSTARPSHMFRGVPSGRVR